MAALTLDGIKQFNLAIDHEEWKLDTLRDLYEVLTIDQSILYSSIIYCNTRRKADWLAARLRSHDFVVSEVDSDMGEQARAIALTEFRRGCSRILVTTDTCVRDAGAVPLVINYDFPTSCETYINRIGRSGRFGHKGVTINFVTLSDARALRDVEQRFDIQIEDMPMNVADLL
ncbi:hypothetical protein H310_11338 [Aphanomyces invadans]|uniref:Helicase C-terminal domain-containing protein n=1 Tax=Aphanomyces invadans TaxID=157072 RepID=A0A024TN29_9STRA|nr:hypothetical protein H310_11338 [Aphanomyces invadans]ETV95036.1 hypothetical protein H310_11338 [Aphanomyces invadans]|eukprot:XP_008876209.1 hypothetical protein H310_11338 [Aphanomyces invadans]